MLILGNQSFIVGGWHRSTAPTTAYLVHHRVTMAVVNLVLL